MTLDELLRLTWSWGGPVEVVEDGDTHFEVRVTELPEFYAAGATKQEAIENAIPSLRAYLLSFLENDDMPPLPAQAPTWQFVVQPGTVESRNEEKTDYVPEGDLQAA